MPHTVTVLVGPARCGKTHHLIGQYWQALQKSALSVGRTLWLAPTARAAAAVRQQLIGPDQPACLDPGVTTFAALAGRILALAPTPPRPLTLLGERTILRGVIAAALQEKSLHYFAEVARGESFVDLLAEHFHELKRHGVTADGFARSIGHHGDKRKHAELSQLYTAYERALAEHRLADEEGRNWSVRDALAADPSLYANLELVVADGFTDFTHTQLETLAQLAVRSGRLQISLPGEQSGTASRADLFAKSTATLAELRHLFPKLTTEYLPCRPTTFPALDHIAAHLFEHPRDVPKPSAADIESLPRIEIIAAAGVQDEIVQLARNIKQRLISEQIRTGHARPGDVVVVFRNLRDAAPRVRDVFTEFGIPHALEAGVPLAATGVMRTLLDLLRLDAENWPFRRLVSIVTNNLLTNATREERTAAEWLIRDLQFAQGRDPLLARLGEVAAATGNPRRATSATQALPFLTRLATALTTLPASAAPNDWLTALTALGTTLGIDALTGSTTNPDNHAAWQEIEKHFITFERLAEWRGEPAPQLIRAAVLELLVDLAEHESLPRRSDDTGRVRILSAATARNIDARHVYLAGMSEQSFPSPERPGSLYGEADYRFFANAADQPRAVAELPEIRRSQDEMLLFYEILTRAGESLTISYPALDEKAQALPPSPYVTEIERAVAPATIAHLRAPRPSPLPIDASPLSPADWRILAVHEALETADKRDLSLLAGLFRSDRREVASALESALRINASRSRRDAFGPAEGLLESDAIRRKLAKRFGSEHLWSPSQWETYAACPYQFFMKNVLALEPLGELVLETDHARRGSMVHRVLAELHRRLPELLGDSQSIADHELDKFVEQFDNILDALARATRYSGVEAALVELDRLQIAKWGPTYHREHGKYDAAWAGLDEPFAPTHFEWRFGPPRREESDYEDPHSTSEPFVLDLGDEKVRVTGRIDRIDVGQSSGRAVFNVIDYKSGKATGLRKEHIQSGERLQPAVYVLAAQQLLFNKNEAIPVFAGYWSMVEGVKLKGSLRFGDLNPGGPTINVEWSETLQPQVVEIVKRFVTDIRQGNFPVASRDEHCTSRCDFATVCRIAQVRSLGKQFFPELEDA